MWRWGKTKWREAERRKRGRREGRVEKSGEGTSDLVSVALTLVLPTWWVPAWTECCDF